MSAPKRIQRRRTKGWRMPAGAICVSRPSIYSNPFWISEWHGCGCMFMHHNGKKYIGEAQTRWTKDELIAVYRAWVTEQPIPWPYGHVPPGLNSDDPAHRFTLPLPPTPLEIACLRGADLACWCALDQPCHADVLLQIANPVSPGNIDAGHP